MRASGVKNSASIAAAGVIAATVVDERVHVRPSCQYVPIIHVVHLLIGFGFETADPFLVHIIQDQSSFSKPVQNEPFEAPVTKPSFSSWNSDRPDT